ncbi:MAG: class I SAM-dependent methyltransferase, partial [Promethearchaeota archaeon]
SDISLTAIIIMKNAFKMSDLYKYYKNRVEFHAIDALNLPFPENSIDIIYGYAFVHHINDLSKFFFEINRVLRKGGEAIFFDCAYSPIWQILKNTLLKPLQKYSHRRNGISPEDLKATKKGGFRKEELEELLQPYNLKLNFFNRLHFFTFIWERGCKKLFRNSELFKIFMPFFNKMDIFLAKKSKIFRDNQIRLIWGIRK